MRQDNEMITQENITLHAKIRVCENNEEVLTNQIENLLKFIEELETNNKELMKTLDD